MKSIYLHWLEENKQTLEVGYKVFIRLTGHKWSFNTYCKQQFTDSDLYNGF